MDIPESVAINGTRRHLYGDAYQTADGATVIPVTRVRAGIQTPAGVFVVHGGNARWVPAIDSDRIALIGVTTGLLAAVIASLALLRRPPWPDLSATSDWARR